MRISMHVLKAKQYIEAGGEMQTIFISSEKVLLGVSLSGILLEEHNLILSVPFKVFVMEPNMEMVVHLSSSFDLEGPLLKLPIRGTAPDPSTPLLASLNRVMFREEHNPFTKNKNGSHLHGGSCSGQFCEPIVAPSPISCDDQLSRGRRLRHMEH